MMRFGKPDEYGIVVSHFSILACRNDRFYVGSKKSALMNYWSPMLILL